ncbi:TPA: ParA family protein [Staphylococcus aureus]|jgi:chromosome partitioning protein|nr:ParA family protein [Staphylococcus aureus]HCX3672985.1 ParA family protein [Staphylococcus aureus]
MARKIANIIHRGGAGKSTNSEMEAYFLATLYNKKTLLVDSDDQADVSRRIKRTFNKTDLEPKKRFMQGIRDFDLSDTIISLHENLDLLQGDWHLENFDDYLSNNVEEKGRFFLFYTLFKELDKHYDYIIFDTKPRTSKITNNVVCASDYVIIPTKVSKGSIEATQRTYNYLAEISDYNEDIELVGIIPYFESETSRTNKIFKELKQAFGDDVYKNKIKWSDRVLTWEDEGVSNNALQDKFAMRMFKKVMNETMKRIEKIEEANNNGN